MMGLILFMASRIIVKLVSSSGLSPGQCKIIAPRKLLSISSLSTREELGHSVIGCARMWPYQPVTWQVPWCDFVREEAYIKVNTCHFVVKFAHNINPISQDLLWRLSNILNTITQRTTAIHFALIWSRLGPYYVTMVPVLHTPRSRLCPYYTFYLNAHRLSVVNMYFKRNLKKEIIECQWIGHLRALAIFYGD